MFFFNEPDSSTVARFIESERNQPFSYEDVGATAANPPTGFTLDHNRIQLGYGRAVFESAVIALRNWRQFDLGWVSIVPAGVEIEVDAIVAVKARAFGTWSLSATRVVYVIDEETPVKRFGFAYGTLPDHVEQGEERFSIELLDDGSVWYDIFAFSRPHHPLVRLSYPLARMLQKRFARDSMQRMTEIISHG
jgi:uncharacterized protein (UPF0548 family)